MYGKSMFGNCKFLRIWTNGNLHLLGFSNVTTPHEIWKSILKRICTPNYIFSAICIDIHQYQCEILQHTNPQRGTLIPVIMKNHQIYKFPTCCQTWSIKVTIFFCRPSQRSWTQGNPHVEMKSHTYGKRSPCKWQSSPYMREEKPTNVGRLGDIWGC